MKTANEKPKPAAVINGTSGMIGEALVEQLYEIGQVMRVFAKEIIYSYDKSKSTI